MKGIDMYPSQPLTNSFKQSNGCPAVQAWIDGLNYAATALLAAGTQPSQLTARLTDQIAAVERGTRRKVVLCNGRTDGRWFQFAANHGADYARVTKPNEVRLLSAKIGGVVMSANFFKPGKYTHDNAHVAQVLRTLADLIEKAPVPLADNDIELSMHR